VSRRLLTAALRPLGTREVWVVGGPLRGARMRLDLATHKAYWAGRYEPELQRAIAAIDLQGRTAWDVGAHIGFFTLLLARRAERVLAVEANPETAARLRRNVELNHAPVDVIEAAVAGAPGTVRFDARSGEESAESSIATHGSREVRAVTLDELLAEHGTPAFVKLDVEGAELDALRAAPQLLAARPAIACEVHGGDEQRRAIAALLEGAGYRLTWSDWRVLAR
jgi:FkbM family methyltransferase